MKMVIRYKDSDTQPQFVLNENGKVEEIYVEAPFILVNRTSAPTNEERLIDIEVGVTKKCSHCGEEKFIDEYHKNYKSSTGCQTICISCKKKIDQDRREEEESNA